MSFYIKENILKGLPKELTIFLYAKDEKPKNHWLLLNDENLIRIELAVIDCILFPEKIDCRKEWTQCVLSISNFQKLEIFQTIRTPIKLEPMHIIKTTLHHKSIDVQNCEPKVGWIHKYDAVLFKKKVIPT